VLIVTNKSKFSFKLFSETPLNLQAGAFLVHKMEQKSVKFMYST